MDADTLARRGEIARRLKAARWLAGGVQETTRNKSGWEVTVLTVDDLAQRSPLPENKITAHKLGTIERMERHTPPMELAAIAEALGVTREWFATDGPTASFDLLRQALADLGLVPEQGEGEGSAPEHDKGPRAAGGEGGGA